jgi:hypothetical protein
MGINVSAISAAINHNILLRILKKDTSKNATAIKAGIAPSKFYRNIDHPEQFTLRELGQIAEALDLTLPDILSTELIAPRSAA